VTTSTSNKINKPLFTPTTKKIDETRKRELMKGYIEVRKLLHRVKRSP
jgi:hypothetical protein